MKIDVTLYKGILDKYNIELSKTEYNRIIHYMQQDAYEKVLYNYRDKPYIATVIKYYELMEDYKKCAEIKKFVDVENRVNGRNTLTNIESYVTYI